MNNFLADGGDGFSGLQRSARTSSAARSISTPSCATSWRTSRVPPPTENRDHAGSTSAVIIRSHRGPGATRALGSPGYTAPALTMATDDMTTTAGAKPASGSTGPDGELIPDYESTFPEINEGQVVHGTVVRVDKDEVLVDIGYKSEGVIPVSELSIRRSVNPADEVCARRRDRRARAHEGGRRRPPDPLEEARALRARVEERSRAPPSPASRSTAA